MVRNLQILLELSKLWKGELAQHLILPFRKKREGFIAPAKAGVLDEHSEPKRIPQGIGGGEGGHVLGEFYG